MLRNSYIKEFVHGDFGRTIPNLCQLLKTDTDILELDVEVGESHICKTNIQYVCFFYYHTEYNCHCLFWKCYVPKFLLVEYDVSLLSLWMWTGLPLCQSESCTATQTLLLSCF